MPLSEHTIKTLGPRGGALLSAFATANQNIFTREEARKVLGISSHSTGERLRLLVARGWLRRLTRGLYLVLPLEAGDHWTEDPVLIAARLVQPSYLSFWSALHLYSLTEQVPSIVTLAVRQSHPPIEISGLRYIFSRVSKRKFFGQQPFWVGTHQVPVATPEKAILDSLDNPLLGGGITEIAKALANLAPRLDEKRLLLFARRMRQGSVIKRLGYLLEILGIAPHLIPRLQKLVTAGYPALDPTLGPGGKHLSRWRLRVNLERDILLASLGT